jgi:DNA-binding transcriptional MocR family regulator
MARTLLQEPPRSAPTDRACRVDTSLAYRINAALHKPNTVKLGAAIPGMELLPVTTLNRLIGQVIRQKPELAHAYVSSPGCIELRTEIARRMLETGCSIAPEDIVTTNGTTEAIYLSLKAVTQPGDTVAIESPTYYGILGALESLHLQALELPTHPREGICLDALETAAKQGRIAACVVVSNFSNPCGSCMSDQKKKALAELVDRYNLPLIEDDIYGDLYFEGSRPKAIQAFDRRGLVMYCASFSKTLSPGLRIGWAVPGTYRATVEQLKLVTNYATAVVPQWAIAAFLSNGGYDRHLRKLRAAYRSNVQSMTRAIETYFPPNTRVTRPLGGHVLWVELPGEISAMQLYRDACQHGISIAPGPMFSASGNYANYLRLNCGLPWSAQIEGAIATLGRLIEQQQIIR